MPYLIVNLLLLVTFFVVLNQMPISRKDRNTIALIITFGCILFFHTFKDYRTLPDIPGYVRAWKYICHKNSLYMYAGGYYKMQWGYFGLNKLLSYISHSTYFFLFAMGCIVSLPYCYLISKYSKNIQLSCILYFMGFIQSTFVLRQHAAIGFCLLSIPMLIEGKKTRLPIVFSLWIVAMTLHPTAVVFGLAIMSIFIKDLRLWHILLLVLGGALYLLYPYLVVLFVNNTSGYQVYANAIYGDYGNYSTAFLHCSLWLIAVIAIYPFEQISGYNRFFYKVMSIIAIFALVSAFRVGGELIPRLIMYFTAIECIFIPNVGRQIKNRPLRYAFYGLFLTLNLYLFAFSGKSRINECHLIF